MIKRISSKKSSFVYPKFKFLKFLSTIFLFVYLYYPVFGQSKTDSITKIKRTTDFAIDGKGTAENWSKTQWLAITPISASTEQASGLATRAKVLYSKTGIYFLFECKDSVLTATMEADFMQLWKEDVVEVFLWPDENVTTYFEYELSPLNYELLLFISNNKGETTSRRPRAYKGDRRTRHMTSVTGGKKRSGATVTQWTAEFFIPYKLLRPLLNTPPEPETKWRANLYRIDYDEEQILMAWQPVEKSFHEYQKFGTFLFE